MSLLYKFLPIKKAEKCVHIFIHMYATCQWLLHGYHVRKEVFDLADSLYILLRFQDSVGAWYSRQLQPLVATSLDPRPSVRSFFSGVKGHCTYKNGGRSGKWV